MEFPTVAEVFALHDQILATTGGTRGLLNAGGVDSAIERCKWGPFVGTPTLASRAAFLFRGIAQDHPFADGNKRTAFAVGNAFLLRNGFHLGATDDEVIDFMLAIAQGQADIERISGWIGFHQRKDYEGV